MSQACSKVATFVSVILDSRIDFCLDYLVPEEMIAEVAVGKRVEVTLRGKVEKATILELKNTSPYKKIFPVKRVLNENSFLKEDQLKLLKWIEEYYCVGISKALKLFIPSTVRNKEKGKEQFFIKPLKSLEDLKDTAIAIRQKFPAQAKVIDALMMHPEGLLLSELLQMAGATNSPIDTLVKKKLLSKKKISLDRSESLDFEFFPSKPKKLNNEQSKALESIHSSIESRQSKTHLLHGVTGSGKTEVYLQAMSLARELGLSVILMVPEVSLTTQTVERIKSRFSEKIAILHHRLSHGERYDMWHQIRDGKISIVVGARSAIFAPLDNLGLIIVDEEHDSSYKQTDEAPCYNARDLAIYRAHLTKSVTILGSATPSIESYTNASNGKYILNTLNQKAASSFDLDFQIIDMVAEKERSPKGVLFSQKLLSGIEKRIKKGEQALLFLNRRGYHSVLLCSSCEKSFECPSCDVCLTYHKKENFLSCHYCGYSQSPPPRYCPSCKKETIEFKGVGTEKVEATLKAIFKGIRTLRMDADTTRHKGSHEKIYREFRQGKADVLIGTQMIAKGFDFPQVTLVGILSADGALHIADFRSEEHLFQLLMQVSGRSGRGALPGEVFLQTYLKDHPLYSLVKAQDYLGFYQREINNRKLFLYPPYTRLIKVIFKGSCQKNILNFANAIHQQLIHHLPSNVLILPVLSAYNLRIKDQYRYYFLIKTPSILQVTKAVKSLLKTVPKSKDSRLLIDVDPLFSST